VPALVIGLMPIAPPRVNAGGRYPLVRIRNRLGIKSIGLKFETRSMLCITELYNLFYLNGQKLIPENIYDLLTPAALATARPLAGRFRCILALFRAQDAYLNMEDGFVKPHGLIICTDSYKVKDRVRLINVLIIKYRLDCILRYHTPTQPRIYIRQPFYVFTRNYSKPHMHYSMYYKLKI
jgi:hypothetical protein